MPLRPLSISLADRAHAESTPPTLTEIDGIVAPSGITLTETLNMAEGLRFNMTPSKQSLDIRSRFFDLTAQGTEVWAADPDTGVRMFAGELIGYNPRLQGDEIVWEVRASGLLSYLKRWRIEPPTSILFGGVDQAIVAKGLIDYYQDLDYGDYGIDTSAVVNTGVTRERFYDWAENHLIDQRLAELAAVQNGFDYHIDPTTREFHVDYPMRGQDLTSSVIIDGRSIADPSAQISIGPEDVAAVAYALGDDGLVSAPGAAENVPLMQAIGRSTFISSFSGVTVQATLDDHAERLVTERATQLHDPAKVLFPIGLDWEDFEVGSLVQFAYDYGAGLMLEDRRILTREMRVEDSGGAVIGVGFK